MPATYTLISSNVLTTTAASVTFSAIPSTYTDLVVRMSIRSSTSATSAGLLITCNSDSSALYSSTDLKGDGTSSSSSRMSNQNSMYLSFDANAATSTSNTFSNLELYLPSYTSTASKPMSSITAMENNATTAFLQAFATLYRNTTAISSITISFDAGNFVSGSSFYLYGISNA
jgi:hypothetical protein